MYQLNLSKEIYSRIVFLLKYKKHLNHLKSRIEITNFFSHFSCFRDFNGSIHDLIYYMADNFEYEILDQKDPTLILTNHNPTKYYFIIKGEATLYQKKKDTEITQELYWQKKVADCQKSRNEKQELIQAQKVLSLYRNEQELKYLSTKLNKKNNTNNKQFFYEGIFLFKKHTQVSSGFSPSLNYPHDALLIANNIGGGELHLACVSVSKFMQVSEKIQSNCKAVVQALLPLCNNDKEKTQQLSRQFNIQFRNMNIDDNVIYDRGHQIDSIYFVLQGSVELKNDNKVLCTYQKGDIFGYEEYFISDKRLFTAYYTNIETTVMKLEKDKLYLADVLLNNLKQLSETFTLQHSIKQQKGKKKQTANQHSPNNKKQQLNNINNNNSEIEIKLTNSSFEDSSRARLNMLVKSNKVPLIIDLKLLSAQSFKQKSSLNNDQLSPNFNNLVQSRELSKSGFDLSNDNSVSTQKNILSNKKFRTYQDIDQTKSLSLTDSTPNLQREKSNESKILQQLLLKKHNDLEQICTEINQQKNGNISPNQKKKKFYSSNKSPYFTPAKSSPRQRKQQTQHQFVFNNAMIQDQIKQQSQNSKQEQQQLEDQLHKSENGQSNGSQSNFYYCMSSSTCSSREGLRENNFKAKKLIDFRQYNEVWKTPQPKAKIQNIQYNDSRSASREDNFSMSISSDKQQRRCKSELMSDVQNGLLIRDLKLTMQNQENLQMQEDKGLLKKISPHTRFATLIQIQQLQHSQQSKYEQLKLALQLLKEQKQQQFQTNLTRKKFGII